MNENIPIELLQIVFEHILWIHTALQLRLVSKDFNSAFFSYITSRKTNHVMVRRTFLDLSRCGVCEGVNGNDIACFRYSYDTFPERYAFACRRTECFVTALWKFASDANICRVFPFVRWKETRCNIPRTSGGYSIGRVIRNSPIIHCKSKSAFCVSVVFGNSIFPEKVCRHSLVEIEKENFYLMKSVNLKDLTEVTFNVDNIFTRLFCKEFKSLPDSPLMYESYETNKHVDNRLWLSNKECQK